MTTPKELSWEEKLRAEWLQFYAKLGVEPIQVGQIAKNTIADWWLSKVSSLLSQERSEIIKLAEGMKMKHEHTKDCEEDEL